MVNEWWAMMNNSGDAGADAFAMKAILALRKRRANLMG